MKTVIVPRRTSLARASSLGSVAMNPLCAALGIQIVRGAGDLNGAVKKDTTSVIFNRLPQGEALVDTIEL